MSLTLCRPVLPKLIRLLRHGSPRSISHDANVVGAPPAGLFAALASDISGKRSHEEARWVSSHKVDIRGAKLHFEKGGLGNHVVLLLPGALGSSRTDFGPQLDNLNKDLFTVIAWDPRGYGKSIPPERDWPEHFLERDADDAAALMDRVMAEQQTLELKRFSLLGWSDGGITAMILAAKYPERVRKLVVWGSNAHVTQEDCDLYEKVRDVDKWSANMKKPMIDMYGEEYFRSTWNGWVDAFSDYFKNRAGDICKGDLAKIQCPTLIIHGEKDPIVPQSHADFLKENIANSQLLTFPKGKHNLHLRYFQEFNSKVEQFLTSIDA